MEKIVLTIDGQPVEVEGDATVLEAAQTAGIYIPILCHDADLKPTGDCGLCLVEIEGTPELPTACTTPATSGMRVRTNTPQINKARRTALEPILTEHPSECLICHRRERCGPFDICLRTVSVSDRCVICPKNKNCDLQRVVDYIGITDLPIHYQSRSLPVDNSNPFFHLDRNYCILCRKCVRTCREVNGVGAIEIAPGKYRDQVNPIGNKRFIESICESCGECVMRCPVAALVPKQTMMPTREILTTCPYCGVGCTMYLGTRGDKIVSVRGDRANPASKGRLCVKGRFGATEYISHPDRLTSPLVRTGSEFTHVSWDEALGQVAGKLNKYKPEEVAVVASAKCTNEENYVLQKFTRAVLGTHSIDHCARL